MFRRLFGFLFAFALTVGSAYLFIVTVFFVWIPVKLVFVFATGVTTLAGVYWLWSDFVSPAKELED